MKIPYTESERHTIVKVIKKYFPVAEILVFGSRANGKFKPTSDLDLCLKTNEKLDLATWAKLEEELSQSNLSYKIDIVDINRISDEFRLIIEESSKIF